jgi:predicted TIM-barrel fold metal-dependent hydrolase
VTTRTVEIDDKAVVPESPTLDVPIAVVSSDAHIGPRLEEDLRPYCPKAYLDRFDAYVEARRAAALERDDSGDADRYEDDGFNDRYAKIVERNNRTRGHFDVEARLADMDRDGVAAEVLFHGSCNGQPLPFSDADFGFGFAGHAKDPELDHVGRQIYNRWLAAFCAAAPERFIGLAQANFEDLTVATEEVRWAHAHGLRGVNFPSLRPDNDVRSLESPEWEPLFATCEELGMVLNTHILNGLVGFLGPHYTGHNEITIETMESGWVGRRNIWHMTMTGVFERYPGLQLVITEIPGLWWQSHVTEMDSLYYSWAIGESIRQHLPKPPHEYVRNNISFGASFQSRLEATEASAQGFAGKVMWGSDYPHAESTWYYTDDPSEVSVTRLSLQHTFHGLPETDVRDMCGANIVRTYGLDAGALGAVAERIGALTPRELLEAPDLSLIPSDYRGWGFRVGDHAMGGAQLYDEFGAMLADSDR